MVFLRYLTGQNFGGQNFRRTKFLGGQNFRHQVEFPQFCPTKFFPHTNHNKICFNMMICINQTCFRFQRTKYFGGQNFRQFCPPKFCPDSFPWLPIQKCQISHHENGHKYFSSRRFWNKIFMVLSSPIDLAWSRCLKTQSRKSPETLTVTSFYDIRNFKDFCIMKISQTFDR